MHDDVLLISFNHHASLPCSFCTLFPHFMLVFFSIPVVWEHICILNVRLGGETDQKTSSCIRSVGKQFKSLWDGPVNLVGRGREGWWWSGRMTSEQLFFAAIVGLQFFFSGHNMCRAIFFYSNFFLEGEGGG